MISPKELATNIDKSPYPFSPDAFLTSKLKENGLILVYGSSDDTICVSGAINDSEYISNCMAILLSKEGILKSNEDLDTDEELDKWRLQRENSRRIHIVWSEGEYDWEYETDIKHVTFEILDGDEKYCRGLIFKLEDLR
jgi:hypothetical protein